MSIPANEVMQIRFRTVNGITIRYAESDGHQDSFILLTCPWPESLYAFLPIWQPLSEHSHLLAIDLPGFGRLAVESPARQRYHVFAGMRAAAGKNAPKLPGAGVA